MLDNQSAQPSVEWMKDYIQETPDFPQKGVSFKDISPLLASAQAFQQTIDALGSLVQTPPDYWLGIEARGFLLAPTLAYKFGGGMVMCRKSGKLPEPAIHYRYETEYSKDELSLHPGKGTVVIVDDVLATGGTLLATEKLCEQAGYTVIDHIVLIDLAYVPRLPDFQATHANRVKSLIRYE